MRGHATGDVMLFPGQQVTTLSRLVTASGALIGASDLSAIRLQIFEPGSNDPIVVASGSATSVTVLTSAFGSALSTDSGWSTDEQGYNFSHAYDTSSFLKGGRTYRMEYRVTTNSLGVLYVISDLIMLPTGQDPA